MLTFELVTLPDDRFDAGAAEFTHVLLGTLDGTATAALPFRGFPQRRELLAAKAAMNRAAERYRAKLLTRAIGMV